MNYLGCISADNLEVVEFYRHAEYIGRGLLTKDRRRVWGFYYDIKRGEAKQILTKIYANGERKVRSICI